MYGIYQKFLYNHEQWFIGLPCAEIKKLSQCLPYTSTPHSGSENDFMKWFISLPCALMKQYPTVQVQGQSACSPHSGSKNDFIKWFIGLPCARKKNNP